MAYTDVNTPVVQKITLPSGNEYYIADRQLRNVVDGLAQTIAGGVSFNIAYDGTDTPVVSQIPAGVKVVYNNTEYTGTMAASSAQAGAFYLVKSGTTAGQEDVYDEYIVVDGGWEKIGDTQIDLTDVVTDVDIVKSSSSVIGSNATFTITQPTISLATDTTSGTGKVQVVTGITSAAASGDSVTALTGLGSPSTKSAIGASSTFTITQPTITLATDTTSGTGKVQVATGLGTPTTSAVLTGVEVTAQPSVTLTANTATDTGRIQYVQSQGTATTTKLSAAASGGAVSASGDNVTALTGLGTPSTQSAVKSVSPTTKKLGTTTVIGVGSSTTTASKATSASITYADGTGTASSTNTDWLKGVSVSNGSLIIGAATMDTATESFSDVTVPVKNANATTVATGSVVTTGSGADVVTDVAVGDTFNAVTGYASPTTDTVIGTASTFSVTNPTVTISSGSTGDVTVATGIGNATTRYLSASASGTTVGGTGTADAITAISPTTTYIKGTASGANTAWNSKDTVTAVTGYASPTTDTVLGTGSTISVTPTTTYIKGTASGANTAWNSKDTKTVANYSDLDVNVTKGS